MAKLLTDRQRQVLKAIQDYSTENGYMPSIRELGRLLGISSLRGVTIHLDALEKKGFIKRESTSRSIKIITPTSDNHNFRPVPLLSKITSGIPITSIENIHSYLPVSEEIIGKSGEPFAVKAQGDKMINDHIMDGDIIIVKPGPNVDNGDIVAALIDNGTTVCKFDNKSHPPRLIYANPEYKAIELTSRNTQILGKVAAVIRKYD